MRTMAAARLNLTSHTLTVEEVPVPTPGPGEVLIQVKSAGVCLSDVHLVEGVIRPQFLDGDVVTLGHEVAGVIDACGPGIEAPDHLETGMRVLLQAGHRTPAGRILTRGVDYDGGYAEYALARAETVVPIPDSLSFDQAAIIPDAVSTPWAAVSATAHVHAGEAIGVWGLGGLGAHAVQLLRMSGAAPIIGIDPLPAARDRALCLGADVVAHPDEAAEVIAGIAPDGVDAAFDFAGVAAVRTQALQVLARHGRLVVVGLAGHGLEIESDMAFAFKGQSVIGNYGSEAGHVRELVHLLQHGRLDFSTSITDTFPLSEAPAVIERLERKEGNPIRFVLHP
ncbi:alcohol dehydrogenase [Austwickia sp. TVS 96-490-7B]|uniref:zinc-binding dehydrogenase n=1 Tax=Austwickia sp. TVS 96-490-7B TaxID=2830843 RepID=UPI001C58C531|nr:zinc-binding dehydrogenase [Austwickia sp. TVS 96-490-7B]MBW3085913.1 alcohol dehydrogenase [Austwickia sp. TVS 96-490-7B]